MGGGGGGTGGRRGCSRSQFTQGQQDGILGKLPLDEVVLSATGSVTGGFPVSSYSRGASATVLGPPWAQLTHH